MKKIILMVLISLLLTVTPAQAAKKRIWNSSPVVATKTSTSKTPSVSAKITGWKQYVNLNFRGLDTTNGVTYELTYSGNGSDQGVYGDIKPENKNIGRSLFLGTCSHNVCTAHKNVSNLRLTITYKMKNGGNILKKYKIKY